MLQPALQAVEIRVRQYWANASGCKLSACLFLASSIFLFVIDTIVQIIVSSAR